MIDDEGYYRIKTGSLNGVVPGQYLATVTATQILLPKDPDGTPSGPPIGERVGIVVRRQAWQQHV